MVQWSRPILLVLAVVAFVKPARAQTTPYHLHKEMSVTNSTWDQLKTAGPDYPSSFAIASADLKNTPARGAWVKRFDTQGGLGTGAVIPATSTVNFSIFMTRTGTTGTFYPRFKVFLNDELGTSLCTATGTSPLSTATSQVILSCQTGNTPITVMSTDRFFLWVGISIGTGPGNKSATASVKVETSTDSTIVVHVPQPATITTLTPNRGPQTTPVHIAGNHLGSSQG